LSNLAIYEGNKARLVSVIDMIASDQNRVCSESRGLFRDGRRQPLVLVVFEDKQVFSICLFAIGMIWGC